MAETIWGIADLEREVADGYVHRVSYRVDRTDEGFFSVFSGDVFLPRPEENFIEYDDLTEEIVVGWVQDFLTPEGVEAVNRSVEADLEYQKHPTKANGLPWSPMV